jgi:hypothetical protein
VQVSELFPGYSHFFKVTPIPPVRSKYCQPAAFIGTLPVEIGDGLHETTPTPKQGYENKSSMMSQCVRASYNQVIANDMRSEHECAFWATLVSRAPRKHFKIGRDRGEGHKSCRNFAREQSRVGAD